MQSVKTIYVYCYLTTVSFMPNIVSGDDEQLVSLVILCMLS